MADDETGSTERRRDRLKARARRAYDHVPLSVRTGDLPKRAGSAVVMLAVAGFAVWQGGVAWSILVAVVGMAVLWEWAKLARRFAGSPVSLLVWFLAGALYVMAAGWTLLWLRGENLFYILALAGSVIATDIGAYFSGRIIGGPKIAPRISPSKTWAGLLGGCVFTTLFLWLLIWSVMQGRSYLTVLLGIALLTGPLVAIVAQMGDFFESWMKRRAGVKDSGNLIPGHGGLFDRVDGLMAVALLAFPFTLAWQ